MHWKPTGGTNSSNGSKDSLQYRLYCTLSLLESLNRGMGLYRNRPKNLVGGEIWDCGVDDLTTRWDIIVSQDVTQLFLLILGARGNKWVQKADIFQVRGDYERCGAYDRWPQYVWPSPPYEEAFDIDVFSWTSKVWKGGAIKIKVWLLRTISTKYWPC